MIKVRLIKGIEIKGYPKTWGLIRISDNRTEAAGFRSVKEAEDWAPKWGCEIVSRENSLSHLELGNEKYGSLNNSKWRIVRRSSQGLTDPQDGFRTPKFEYYVYAPGSDNVEEIFKSKSSALAYVKTYGGADMNVEIID